MPSLPSSPYKSLSYPLPTRMLNLQPKRQIMSPIEKWETFSDRGGSSDDDNNKDDDILSFCDLPVTSLEDRENDANSSEFIEDFEFHANGNGILLTDAKEADMCTADDIFFRGRLLPSKTPFGPPSYGAPTDPSLGLGSSRSFSSNSVSSSNSSSTTVSRSQSSSSRSSNCDAPPRLSVSNKFYAHPSPKPQVRTGISSGRRSTGSAPPGWAVFRLGVAKAPEIELSDLKLRRLRSNDSKCAASEKKSGFGFGFGFGCKYASDACQPVSASPTRTLIQKKNDKSKKKEVMGIGFEGRESNCKSSKMFEWLEELSIGKGSAVS